MKKTILLPFISLVAISYDSLAMDEVLDERGERRSGPPTQPHEDNAHPAFTHYFKTGNWGQWSASSGCGYGELDFKKNASHPLYTRGTTFYIEETSNRK